MSPASSLLVVALLALNGGRSANASPRASAAPPNIFFILVDDLGYADVGFNRAKPDREVVTPNLDELVATGVHLTRHYVHQFCTPTRTSVQSGRLPVHVSTGLGSPCGDSTGISQNMTGFAERLKEAGYTTAFAGKWDAGMATPAHTPHGRGYDTSLNYFSHKNDFWSQANMQTCCESDQTIIDFWHTDRGASDVNSTGYSEFLYRDELVGIIEKHGPRPNTVAHGILTWLLILQWLLSGLVPKEYYDKFSFMQDDEGKCSAQTVKGLHSIDPRYPDLEYKCRQQYHAMVNIMDEVVGNITNAIKAKGAAVWENTLVVMSSDNGGPVDLAENAANNWPKRGGKYSLFEGGISVAAFVSGGYLPPAVRGTTNNGIVHIADWYATFLGLAKLDPADKRAAAAVPAVPPIDSIDVWPLISGATKVSPRAAIPLPVGKNCIVHGDWKLITTSTSPNFWQGLTFPNSSSMEEMDDMTNIDVQALRDNLMNAAAAEQLEQEERDRMGIPPRPFIKLEPCTGAATGNQTWSVSSGFPATPDPVCSSGGSGLCWNVQGPTANMILWSRSTTSNALFSVKGSGTTARLWSPVLKEGGCIGASGPGVELTTYEDCNEAVASNPDLITHGFSYDAEAGTFRNGDLCVTADMNGTHTHGPGKAGSSGFLFNVVEDPTEQNNLFNDTAQADRIAAMAHTLSLEVGNFFSNRDKFVDDCPADLDPEKDLGCACWMAKHRYGGFMGPFAMLPPGYGMPDDK